MVLNICYDFLSSPQYWEKIRFYWSRLLFCQLKGNIKNNKPYVIFTNYNPFSGENLICVLIFVDLFSSQRCFIPLDVSFEFNFCHVYCNFNQFSGNRLRSTKNIFHQKKEALLSQQQPGHVTKCLPITMGPTFFRVALIFEYNFQLTTIFLWFLKLSIKKH